MLKTELLPLEEVVRAIQDSCGSDAESVATLDHMICTRHHGRQTLRAHGDRDMPVWGPILRSEEGASDYAEAAARGKVVMITEYLESIQSK